MMMTKLKILTLIFLLSMIPLTGLYAQFEEDELDEMLGEQEPEGDCIPEKLITPHDSIANKELSQDLRLVYNFGYEYYKNKNYKEALPYLWKVFIKDNDRYARSAVRKIAEMYFNQGMVDSTLIACYRGLEKFEDLSILHHYAGILQEKLGKFRCAIPHYEKLVEMDSTNAVYAKQLAFFYYKDENQDAIEVQKKVVALKLDDPEERDLLAEYMQYFLGQGADLEERRKTYESNSDNLEYAMDYASAAVDAGKYKEAIVPLQFLISKKPTIKAYELRATANENLNQNNDAIADLKKVIEIDPDNADVMLRIAENYKVNNNFGSGKYWVNKALSAKRGYGKAYITLGELIEASVPYCQKQRGGKMKFEDKLVYLEARNVYEKAKRDPAFRSKAKTKQSYLTPLLPTDEDKFMNKGKTITHKCYDWLK